MKRKKLNRDGWGFRSFPHYRMRLEMENFHGIVCRIRVKGENTFWRMPNAGRVQVTGKGMTWLELIPDGADRVITVIYFPDGTRDPERPGYPRPACSAYQPSAWYADVTDGITFDRQGIAVYVDKLCADIARTDAWCACLRRAVEDRLARQDCPTSPESGSDFILPVNTRGI